MVDYLKLRADIGMRRAERSLAIADDPDRAQHKDPLVEAMKGTVQNVPRRLELNDDQEAALCEITEWLDGLRNINSPAMVLLGNAGTGKSTLMRELVREYPVGQIALTSPTNKATKVLRSMLEAEGLIAPCLTIQSANGLRLSDDLPEKYLTRAGRSSFKLYKLVVVDEASMVGEKMAEMILEEAQTYGTKVLFVGDPMQLPPVKDGRPVAFSGGIPSVKLERIMRQAENNPIIKLGAYFRDLLAERVRPNTSFAPSSSGTAGVHYLKDADFWAAYEEAIRTQEHHDDNRGICFTNAAVFGMADKGRKVRYGSSDNWHVGERIYTTQPIDSGGDPMYTDQEATIAALHEPGPHPIFTDYEARPVQLDIGGGKVCFAYVATPASAQAVTDQIEARYKNASSFKERGSLSAKAWRDYHAFRDAWADIRSVFALTAHRAQGSTFENVFVHAKDIANCKDPQVRWRLFYVACTRARKNVFLLR